MATPSYKVLAQSIPAAVTATDIYTVPALTQDVVSTIAVCNQAGADATFRIAIRVAGLALTAKQYIAYDKAIFANDTEYVTIGATMGAGDIITVYGSSGSISFNVFGTEIA